MGFALLDLILHLVTCCQHQCIAIQGELGSKTYAIRHTKTEISPGGNCTNNFIGTN